MKKLIYSFLVVGLAFLAMPACNDILEEEPKSLLTAQFLESPDGVRSALYAGYSDLRYFYGGEGGMSQTCAGTDEWEKGPDGNATINEYGEGLATEGLLLNTWDWGYTAINTLNGVLENAEDSGMPQDEATKIMAEARYLRATWYFLMVQQYGDMPLNLKFNNTPGTEAYRDPASDVYEAIVNDLEIAKKDLPDIAEEPGRANAAAAYHLLAKVYLTRATHPDARQSSDYQNAYDNAMHLINNKGKYNVALLNDFAKVHEPRNEHSSEVLMTAERNTDSEFNDIEGGNKENRSVYFFRPNYSAIVGGLIRSIEYGRPWHRVRPTNYLLEKVFEDRENDTRYHTSFQTVWLVNDPENVADPSFSEGDTAIWLPGTEDYDPNVKALRVYPPSEYYGNVMPGGEVQTLSIYPSLNKYNDIDRPNIPDPSVRPFIIHRFAETYLIAAEAAMYLDMPAQARELVNVIRARAAYDPDRSDAENAQARQRLMNRTPDFTDKVEGINFILDERSRELAGEYMRWFDLKRTRTSDDPNDIMLLKRLRDEEWDFQGQNIQNFHTLRPIPQGSQIDLTSNEFPQNDGY